MADDDFDLISLASYLHLSPAQILKLVERGKLPGRRVAGDWRFSRAEIHLWLEERIGLSNEGELLRVEEVLAVTPNETDEQASLVDQLPEEAIEMPLGARTRNSVINSMVEVAARTGWLWDPPRMAEAVRIREEMHPTALENGVALMHPRRPMPGIVAQPFLALGRTVGGIPFGGSRGVLTDIFFLICSTTDRGHLRTLARLSRLIASAGFVDALRIGQSAAEIRRLIADVEKELPI